jgi:lysophospholipase L1-like esterase
MTAASRRWVALGDSFTTGVGDAPEHGGWLARAAAALVRDGVVEGLDNLAVPGVRVESVLADQAPGLSGEHLLVSAIAGANDVLHFGLDIEVLAARTTELVRLARRHGVLVLISTCPDFFAHRFGPGSRLSWRVDRLNEQVREELSTAGGQVVAVDTHAVLRDPSLWDDDGVHPNPAGHEALAEAALAVLGPAVRAVEAGVTPTRG